MILQCASLQAEKLERKVTEERARVRTLLEKEKQGEPGEDGNASSVADRLQLSQAPSCSSSEGSAADKPSTAKEGRCILHACIDRLY